MIPTLPFLAPLSWFFEHPVLYTFGGFVLLYFLGSVRYIPNTRVGIVEKRISGKGSLASGLIALNGEAGFQPEVLRGGLHSLPLFQYSVHIQPLVTIPQGRVGYIFARDGKPLPPAQTLASNTTAIDFQDVAAFLRAGGQRGPQRKILREGTYAINLAQFVVITQEQMQEKFGRYNLELQEVLIGTPTAGQGGGQIEQILTQLRTRQIAEE